MSKRMAIWLLIALMLLPSPFGPRAQAQASSGLGSLPSLYVTQNGAKCNGSTDDHVAVQNTVNLASKTGVTGGMVILPASNCFMGSTTLTLPQNVFIMGQGSWVSGLTWNGSATVGIAAGDGVTYSAGVQKGGMAHLFVQGAGVTGSAIGVFLGGDPASVIETSTNSYSYQIWDDVLTENWARGTEVGNNAFIDTFKESTWDGNGQHWLDLNTNTNTGENMRWENNLFSSSASATLNAIELDGVDSEYNVYATSFDYDDVSTADIGCTGTSTFVRLNITDSHFEKTTGPFINVNASGGCNSAIDVKGGSMTVVGTTPTTAHMIGYSGTATGQEMLSITDGATVVSSGSEVTAFVDLGTTVVTATLDSLDFEPFGGATIQPITGSNLFQVELRNTGNLGTINHPFTQVMWAAYTNATTTFTNPNSQMSWPLAANQPITGECYLVYSASAATAAPKFELTGPSSPNAVNLSMQQQLTASVSGTPATYASVASASAFSSAISGPAAGTATATRLTVMVYFGVYNGGTAGTLALLAAAQGTGTLTIEEGSWCKVQ